MEKIGPLHSSQYPGALATQSEASKNYCLALGNLTECLAPAASTRVKEVIWYATNVKAWARSLRSELGQRGFKLAAAQLERDAQGELNHAKAKAGSIDHPAFDLSSDPVGEYEVYGAHVDYSVAKTKFSYHLTSANPEDRKQLKEAAIQLATSAQALEDMYLLQATPESLSLCRGVDNDALFWMQQCKETTGVSFSLENLLIEANERLRARDPKLVEHVDTGMIVRTVQPPPIFTTALSDLALNFIETGLKSRLERDACASITSLFEALQNRGLIGRAEIKLFTACGTAGILRITYLSRLLDFTRRYLGECFRLFNDPSLRPFLRNAILGPHTPRLVVDALRTVKSDAKVAKHLDDLQLLTRLEDEVGWADDLTWIAFLRRTCPEWIDTMARTPSNVGTSTRGDAT